MGRTEASRHFDLTRSSSPISILLAAALTLTTSSALLAVPSKKDLARIDAAIAVSDWKIASEACEQQVDVVATEVLGPGPRADLLAGLAARCAVAAAGGGDHRAASWHWHVANILDANAAAAVAASTGAGVPLGPVRARIELERNPDGTLVGEGVRAPDGSPSGATVPKKISAPMPSLRAMPMKPMTVGVQTIIDVEGRVTEPRIVVASNCTPVQIFGVLRAMRTWRFEPAKLNGAPVSVLYELTTHARVN